MKFLKTIRNLILVESRLNFPINFFPKTSTYTKRKNNLNLLIIFTKTDYNTRTFFNFRNKTYFLQLLFICINPLRLWQKPTSVRTLPSPPLFSSLENGKSYETLFMKPQVMWGILMNLRR